MFILGGIIGKNPQNCITESLSTKKEGKKHIVSSQSGKGYIFQVAGLSWVTLSSMPEQDTL
jgi:hypothetical protein